jgi:hypothetical protein
VPDPVWVGSIAIRAGAYHVGLRTDDAGVLDALRSLYADRSVSDRRATADYGISLHPPAWDADPDPLPYLAHGRRIVARAAEQAHLVRRLDLALGDLEPPPEAELPRLSGFALVTSGGRGVLVPEGAVADWSTTARVFGRLGGGVAPGSALRLDLSASEAVVLGGLSSEPPHRALDDGVSAQPGRYPIAALFWSTAEADPQEGRAAGVVRLVERIPHRGDLAPGDFLARTTHLAQLATRPPLAIDGTSPDLSPVVAALAGSPPPPR